MPQETLTDLAIKGLKPAHAAALKALGFSTTASIAAWSAQDVARVVRALGPVARVREDGWVEQATLLAGGVRTRFAARQAFLDGVPSAFPSAEGEAWKPRLRPSKHAPLWSASPATGCSRPPKIAPLSPPCFGPEKPPATPSSPPTSATTPSSSSPPNSTTSSATSSPVEAMILSPRNTPNSTKKRRTVRGQAFVAFRVFRGQIPSLGH